MQITFKVLVGSDDGKVYEIEAIEHRGALWLVTHWSAPPDQLSRKPVRMLRIDGLPRTKAPPGYQVDIYLSSPIPKAVLDGPVRSEEGHEYEVLEGSDIDLSNERPH